MKIKTILLLCIIINSDIKSTCQNRINIVIPMVEQETDYVWRNIQDIKILEGFNYTIHLPEGKIIDTLIARSKSNRLVQNDYDSLKTFMASKVYKKNDYKKGYEKIEARRELVNKMVNRISKCKRSWNFKEYEVYNIILILYGTGGSYDPDNGSIIIFTTTEGKFKQYENPANTLMHEIIHIGIEESIIRKYNVEHALKERIVDKFVLLNFEKELPQYRIQNMGDKRIDKYLTKKKNLGELDIIIEKFLKEN